MPTTLETHAKEESTYVITVNFTDEDDEAVVPDTIVWTLTDTAGTVINSRENVVVAVPDSEIDIVLSGDDLAIQSGEVNQGVRTLTVEATYDSTLGNDLPLKESVRFIVDNLLVVD